MSGQIARASLAAFSFLILTPGILLAQSAIAGVVRDSSHTGISTINTTFGSAWQRPTLLQLGRYAKLSAQIDF